jgi:hypothetical protein
LGEIRDNSERLFSDLAEFLDTPAPTNLRKQRPQNVGLGAWHGQLLRKLNELSNTTCTRDGGNRPYRRLARFRLDPPRICQKVLGRLPRQPLVSTEVRQQINDAYKEDWHFVTDYIRSSAFRRVK